MRKSEPLSLEIKPEKKLFEANGTVFAELSLSLPHFSGAGAARLQKETVLLRKEVERVAKEFADKAEKTYRENPDPRRRFTHRPYRVEYRGALSFAGEEYVSLSYVFRVSRGGREECRRLFGDTFRRKDGKRMPLFCFMGKKERKKQKTGPFDNYILNEKGIPLIPRY